MPGTRMAANRGWVWHELARVVGVGGAVALGAVDAAVNSVAQGIWLIVIAGFLLISTMLTRRKRLRSSAAR
jgi:hypothetical protein